MTQVRQQQRGFTLLELMVAMAIFAMLAVAGWQVFDSVNRARERAQFHADNLAVLQYAYLQLQQDMGQVIAYQDPDAQNASDNSVNNTNNSNTNPSNNSNQANSVETKPFMSLDGEHVSFMRFADPDPRYQSSSSVQRVEYIFTDERLIRRQYSSIQGGRDSVSLDTVLLEGVTAGRWQAYLPGLSSSFPNENSSNSSNNGSENRPSGTTNNPTGNKNELILLPKGVGVSFTYQDMPISWQWALTPQAIPNNSPINTQGDNANSGDNNNNSNSDDNDNSNNSENSNSDDNNLAGGIENIPTGQ